jgi:diguanylate cyclase (GGDEF)-like protein
VACPNPPVPPHELGRQRDLESYGVLDTPEDEHFARLVRLAARVLAAPSALISLVDGDRQWFLARHGLDVQETPRQLAFCAHAICHEGPLVVPDARLDPRFRDNPLVTGPPQIRFYAGAVLQSPAGHNLGTLCVIDQQPRTLEPAQVDTLQDLAQVVLRELELRRLAQCCSLTGALQRGPFLQRAQRELERSRQSRTGLALLLLEVEPLDLITQHCGHAVADQALSQVAALCRAELRPADLLGRLGDGLLALLLVEVDPEDALQRAEVLREGIQHLHGPYSDAGHQLQLSGGLTLRGEGDTRVDSLLVRAQRAVLLAQGNGRNQIAEVLGSGALSV